MRLSTASLRSVTDFLRLCFGGLVLLLPLGLYADHTDEPASVTIAGSLQDELGCPGDWQPDCGSTHLVFDASDEVWQGTFSVPPGSWEYKAALNNSWDENYGQNAAPGGGNIPLNLGADTDVKFYYDHETHWITDNVNSVIAVAPGNFQSELGCPGDWQPDCLRSWLQDPDGDGIYTFRAWLPVGSYEAKVAIDESWSENYGAGGEQNGPNIPFTVPGPIAEMEFSFDSVTKVLTIGVAPPEPQPSAVTIAGSFQSELGCPDDWQPWCAVTHLAFDATDGVWQGIFSIPAGSWEYKAALNDSWDENYGQNATRDGPNISLGLGAPTDVKFYYEHGTHWVADNVNKVIATVPGSYQDKIGCPGPWQPDCLRSWLQDPDGDGIYSFSVHLPGGNYEAKVAINESWDENYGAGGEQNGPNIPFSVPQPLGEVFFTFDPISKVLSIGLGPSGPVGNLSQQKAHWVAENIVAWNGPGEQFALHYAANGGLGIDEDGITGSEGALPLTLDPAGLPQAVKDKFPHLADYSSLVIADANLGQVPDILKGQIALATADGDGNPADATGLQIPGVLDDLYTYEGGLGPAYTGGAPSLTLWAPTARNVSLLVFADPDPATTPTSYPMTHDPASGTWSVDGPADWDGKYYLFDVEVFVPSTGQVERNQVTDPYSLSLSMNSQRSQFVNLGGSGLKPSGWDSVEKPALAAPEDIVIYELHVRDFSVADMSVDDDYRGTFMAFADEGTWGMNHLESLADAGLTHIHLLPVFDIASIGEDRDAWQAPDPDMLAMYPGDSEEQQKAVSEDADKDGFNWGYDPWHYTVPEGSYSTDPNGPQRVIEFREMVKALNETGLRVVIDVVYNHTNASGQNDKSVLDRIVPGYYHRLNATGDVERSTCCENTASEHAMMEKLMVDSIVTWARDYKVDGFRFDLMGHHSKENMLNVRAALDELTPEKDGVDGKSIYLYGEGWNFGEVANNARFEQATQRNMAGTGIGTFSDRLRDGVRGGNPFSNVQDQGFINGLYYDSNGVPQGDEFDKLLHSSDWIRIGLAGDIADYVFEDSNGNMVRADEVDYFGQQAGYTADPQENITYVAAHDNETLFDATQLKTPVATSMEDRIRIQNLGNSLVMLGQGIPFVHAGQDILRSKSMDRDSFNSGDWFNRVDWTLMTTNWAHGLPVAEKNQDKWPIMQPLLANPALAPQSDDVFQSAERFVELVQIRKSSGLFRLTTADDVKSRVAFHNTGPAQTPALIAASISDDYGSIDLKYEMIMTLFNAGDEPVDFGFPAEGREFELHPVQKDSVDPIVRTAAYDATPQAFEIPARTAAVFTVERPVPEMIDYLMDQVDALVADGALSRGMGWSLNIKLKLAKKSYERGRSHLASKLVYIFKGQTKWLVRKGRLSEEDGQPLVDSAKTILESID